MSTEDLQPCFLSELIEQVLVRIEDRLGDAKEKELLPGEFVHLDTLFKTRVASKAFEILETGTITSYRSEEECGEVIEISEKSSSPITYKLFPYTNYCNCKFFVEEILNAEEKLFYTCEHVLVARLACILGRLNIQVLAKPQFTAILKQIAEN